MKKIFILILVFVSSEVLSQIRVDGLLSVNEFYGKVVSKFDGEHFWVKHNSKYHIYDKKGVLVKKDILLKSEIDIRNFQKNFHLKNNIFITYDKVKLGKKFVSLSTNKNIKTNDIYSTIIPYDNGTYFVIKELGERIGKVREYLYLDKDLNVIYKIKSEYITALNENKIRVLNSKEYNRRVFGSINDGLIRHYNPKSKSFGFINTKGKLIITHKYKAVGDFSEGLAFFQNNDGLYGFINTQGEIVIPAIYSKQPYSFFNKRAKVLSKDGYWGFINNENQLTIDAKYKYATNFYKNYALVKESKLSSILLIDINGTIIQEFDKNLKIEFKQQANTHQDLGLFSEYFTYINPVLKQLVDFKIGVFSNNKNKSGLVDINGNTVLDFKYKSLKDYNNGFVLAITTDENNKEKHGLVNKNGDFIVEVKESKF